MRKLLSLLAGCVVVVLLAVFVLRQEFRGAQTPLTLSGMPACDSLLPKQGPDNVVSLRVSRIADNPGTVCIRVYNGTPEFWRYESEALQIERCWFGLVCFPPLRLRFPHLPLIGGPVLLVDSEYRLFPGYRDFYRSLPDEPTSPGTYRARFRYFASYEEEEQTVYSEEFVLP